MDPNKPYINSQNIECHDLMSTFAVIFGIRYEGITRIQYNKNMSNCAGINVGKLPVPMRITLKSDIISCCIRPYLSYTNTVLKGV